MKKIILILFLMIGLGFQADIFAQGYITCVDVIFPLCPGQLPPSQQFLISPDMYTKSIGTACGDSIQISNPPEHGTVTPIDTIGNLIDIPLDLNFLYEPNTNCHPTDTFDIKIYADGDSIACDSMRYILHFESQCETPDDVFCCISPDSEQNELNVLQNDIRFIEDNYDYDTFAIIIDPVLTSPATNGAVEGPVNGVFFSTPNTGFTGVDSFTYTVTYTITDSTDTYVVCDEQTCYIFVEDCLSTMTDLACIALGDTICIDPIVNDLVEPTLSDPILDLIGCTNPNPLPMIDPMTLTIIDSLGGLWSDGNGGWCFTNTSTGTYTYRYEVCTDVGGCAIDSIAITVKSTCIFDDYIALRALYLSTNGDCWTDNTGWPDATTFLANPNSPPTGFMGFDTWYGINVNAPTGCVENIYLTNNNLNGTLPSELGLFANRLYVLHLEENQIYGNIPSEIGNLTQLTNLILDNNELTGRIPGTLGNIFTLTDLTLFNNDLSGCYDANLLTLCGTLGGSFNNNNSISDGNNFDADWEDFCTPQQQGVCNCDVNDYAALRALYLDTDGDSWFNNTNWLDAATFIANPNSPPAGTDLSTWYGVALDVADCVAVLSLTGNNLNGTIPDKIGDLIGLRFLHLDANQLSGSIPSSIGNLDKLQELFLAFNDLTGNFPREISNLNDLQDLTLNANQLSGCYDQSLLQLCSQLGVLSNTNIAISNGNNFDADWEDFCTTNAGACNLPGNCLTDVQLHVYLEGPCNANNGTMQTSLNTSWHVLPGQTNGSNPPITPAGQPYNAFPWFYTGTEGAGWTNSDYPVTVVDWVMVSLRTGIDRSTEVDRAAALLHNDGSVSFTGYGLFLPTADPVYIVIEHRNHMGVMTPTPLSLAANVLTYDFRMANSYDGNGTGFGQKELAPGVWAMYAGDADQSDFPSYDINGNDKTMWGVQNGNFNVYANADLNMNGDITGADKIIWTNNNGSSSRVPR